ncbi:flagellar biosynthesis protein FliQ [Enterococcus lemanii]|uniref:Flagellar biosynthetic protein FliQ n=1 Tax=Enterococcus lemanii TaxID=1159752 RepID=A0ABV9MV37_9ENTE|nr:flagellar biosynthesis protein FliQ [Enterococcus lemanii]MBM7708068.1 flagellar biosynthetic protein FliQ [Enterococcus lemanii]
MSIELVAQVMRDAFIRILLIAGPSVLVALTVGLVISVFQATTQIQEQTLSFVPKLLAIFLTLMLTGNFMLNLLINFTKSIFKMIATM